MGRPQAGRICFRLEFLGLEKFAKAALDVLLLALRAGLTTGINVRFGQDDERHVGSPSRGDVDGHRAAHAVTHQAALAQSEGVDQGDDRSGVILDAIREVSWLVAVTMPEEVNQERTAPSQWCLNGGRKQLTG
jgi:hypothetical protein